MKKRYLVCAALLGIMMIAGSVQAKEYTTDDGNITINLPEDGWHEVIDPEAEFVFTNGMDVIIANKYGKDEKVELVRNDEFYNAVFQLSYAYGEDLIVLTAQVADAPHLSEIFESITSIKFSGISSTDEEKKNLDNYTVTDTDLTCYANAEEGLNLRESFSVSSLIMDIIPCGEPVHVTGIVTLNGKEIGWDRVEYDGAIGYVSSAHLTENAEDVEKVPTFEEISDDIAYNCDKYMADGDVVHVIVLNDGTMLDNNGHKIVGFADGACQMYDGTIIYDFDPTQMSLEEYLFGGSDDDETGEEE